MRSLVFLLALASVSFSSLLWQAGTDGAIAVKPAVLDGRIVVASSDGFAYGLSPSTGAVDWRRGVGGTFSDMIAVEGGALLSTGNATVIKIDKDGAVVWQLNLAGKEYNATTVYGMSANAARIFATTDAGVFAIDRSGTGVQKIYASGGAVLTPPAAGADFVVFGAGNRLIKLKESGSVEWESTLESEAFWKSRPAIGGSAVYIGALDGAVHAYHLQGGYPKWSQLTRNWVMSTPKVSGGIVYFGSNDGYVYAVYEGSGELKWKSATQLAVESEPEIGTMGGRQVVFVGSTDKSVYAMEADSGEIVWKGSATDWAGSPLFYQNKVIFGSYDGSAYAFSTERACSITSPREADIVGRKELVVEGKSVSQAGGANVYIKINDRVWQKTAIDPSGDWEYVTNPANELSQGLNVILCKVVDSAGEETGAKLTSVGISYDSKIPLSDFVVAVSPTLVEGKQFSIYVNDGDDGSPVDRFTLSVGGNEYGGNGSINLTMEPGSYPFKVSKIGFSDYQSKIEVQSAGISPVLLGAGALLALIILALMWTRVIGPRMRKKK